VNVAKATKEATVAQTTVPDKGNGNSNSKTAQQNR